MWGNYIVTSKKVLTLCIAWSFVEIYIVGRGGGYINKQLLID